MMSNNKIIFLDIDGVLSTVRCMYSQWDKEAMDNLVNLLNKTDAHIVISSSWRDEDREEMIRVFKEHGCYQQIIDRIVGITIRGYKFVTKGSRLPIVRGNEIKEWVDNHLKYPWNAYPELGKEYTEYDKAGNFMRMKSNSLNKDYFYVILDDDTDMLLDQGLNFIKTNPNTGLTANDVEKAIRILENVK